jgi:hypothetical protein
MSKDIKDLLKKIKKQGWVIKQSPKNCHYLAYSPDGKSIVTIAHSTNSPSSVRDAIGHLRRAGAII